MQAGCYDFRSVPKDPEKTRRPFIIGRAYQTQKNNLCVVTVRTTQANEEAGKEALKAITKDLDLKKIHYTDENILTDPNLGFQMEIPSGWRIYTLRADNVLFGRSLSSVHTDSMMIRRLSDDSFKELGLPQRRLSMKQKRTSSKKSQAIHPILQSFIMNPSLSVTFAEVFRSRPIMKT